MAGPTINHEWLGRSNEVDFLKGDGGIFALSLTLSVENVILLRKNLDLCLKNAAKFHQKGIELIAHWGKKTKSSGERRSGYLLKTKVKAPTG